MSDSETTPLIERWNGTTWSIVKSPHLVGGEAVELYGISCVSAVWCVAVGQQDAGHQEVASPLIERWNGSAWSVVSHPAADKQATELLDVSCTSTKWCAAVGFQGYDNSNFAEHWNGSVWSVVPTPDSSGDAEYGGFRTISCGARTFCKALGHNYDIRDAYAGDYIGSWNGTKWSSSTPVSKYLTGVSCPAVNSCVAVGYPSIIVAYR